MKHNERLVQIQTLINQYKQSLLPLITVAPVFEPHRLPSKVQDLLKLTIADTPSFSNIAALSTINYALSHVLGQLRPIISDQVYSRSDIGTNVYSLTVSGSGSGKSSASAKLLDVFAPAVDIIDETRKLSKVERAKQLAYKEFKKLNPSLDINSMSEADYSSFMEPLPRTVVDINSSRGGIASLMAKLQNEQYSTVSIVIDELAMSLKSGNTVEEVMLLLTSMFDMGISTAPEFKGEDYKEATIKGIYPNLLAHTSPTMLFGDPYIRDKLSTLFHTSLARRAFYSHPDEDEACENNPIPDSIDEARHLSQSRKELARRLSVDIAQHMSDVVQRMLSSPQHRKVTFSKEAAQLYMDYFDYCAKQAELLPDSSIRQIEMSGRSWRLGKLAAVWSLYEGSNVISYDTLASAIYLSEYNTKYLTKLVRLTTARPYELMADEFRSGTQYITLHDAVSKGYTTSKSTNFKDLLNLLNSYLRLDGIVSYDHEVKAFTYSKLEYIEQPEAPVLKERCHYSMSYTILPEGTHKDDRLSYLDNFEKFRDDLCETNLVNLLTKDSVYNTFKYKDAPNKHGAMVYMNRNRDNIISSTNIIILDVDKSTIDINSMHSYLEEIPHILSTTSNKDNLMKYRILLPINVELDGTNHKLYSYVVRRLAADLLIEVDKVSFSPSHPYYGYKDSLVLTNNNGHLYDITGYMTEFAKEELVQPKPPKVQDFKTKKAREAHVNSILDNIHTVFSYVIDAPHGQGSLSLARACLHMKDEGFTATEMDMAINYLNDQWESPMPKARIQKLISQYSAQCQIEPTK